MRFGRRPLIALLFALAVVPVLGAAGWAQNGFAQPSPGCTGSIVTTDASGTVNNKNHYVQGESVFINGSGFPPGAAFTFTVRHLPSSQQVASGSFPGSADGNFRARLVWNGANALPGSTGPYEIRVFYQAPNGNQCSAFSNFNYQGPAPTPTTTTIECPPDTAAPTTAAPPTEA